MIFGVKDYKGMEFIGNLLIDVMYECDWWICWNIRW